MQVLCRFSVSPWLMPWAVDIQFPSVSVGPTRFAGKLSYVLVGKFHFSTLDSPNVVRTLAV